MTEKRDAADVEMEDEDGRAGLRRTLARADTAAPEMASIVNERQLQRPKTEVNF